jgi:hypothetical protein
MTKLLYACAVALIAVFILVGCATPTEYHADASHPIRTITVAKEVEVPKQMVFVGFSESLTQALAAGGGVLGGAAASATTSTRPGSEEFHVAETVRSEFITAIQQSGKFTIKRAGPADGHLQLRVTAYGFYQAGVFARRVRPIIGIEAKLTRPDGTVVWQHRRGVSQATGKTPAYLPEKLKADKKLAAEALRVAARLCAETAVRSIRQ